jgi:hypothetical protein
MGSEVAVEEPAPVGLDEVLDILNRSSVDNEEQLQALLGAIQEVGGKRRRPRRGASGGPAPSSWPAQRTPHLGISLPSPSTYTPAGLQRTGAAGGGRRQPAHRAAGGRA